MTPPALAEKAPATANAADEFRHASVAFSQKDWERLSELAPDGDVQRLMARCLSFFEAVVALHRGGFTELAVRNSKGEMRSFGDVVEKMKE